MSPPLSSFGVVWGAQTSKQMSEYPAPKEAKSRVFLQLVGDSEEGVGLKADAEAERWMIDQLHNSQIPVETPGPRLGCRSSRGPAVAGSQLILLGVPGAQRGAQSPALGRASQCAPGAPAAPGPGRA